MKADEAKELLVYSVPEAGRLLSLSRATSYQLAHQGVIPTIRLGRRLVVPKVAIDKMLAEAGKERPSSQAPGQDAVARWQRGG